VQNKINSFIFYAECIVTYLMLRKVESNTKKKTFFSFIAET